MSRSGVTKCQFDFDFCEEEWDEKEISYSLGFIKKPYETERAYLMKFVKHQVLEEDTLLYKTALSAVHTKLEKYGKRVFFYCVCVPGVNACTRSREFINKLKDVPLHFVYLTLETNLRPFSRCSEILPILGGPSAIRSLENSKDWIILDYGQHGINDNYIRENSPSYNKIVPTVAEAFSKCSNVVIVFPWGITKSEIFDLHSCVFQELDGSLFNFDIELHSFKRESDDCDLLIGFYGEGLRLKGQDLQEAYPKSIINLFDALPAEQQRLFAVFDYLIELYGYEEVLNLICEMREIDETPENLMKGVYSRLREIAVDKGVMLTLQGEGYYVDVFDTEKDISDCTKKIVERKLSNHGDYDVGKNEDDYSYRERFFKNRSRFFSNEFQNSDAGSNNDDLAKSKDSIFD